MSAASTALVAARVATLPDALAAVLALPPPSLAGPPEARRFVVTGGGLSEGPARYFTWLLADGLGLRATFVALSAFAGPPETLDGDTLVLFSQGLAPNARLPLLPGHLARVRDALVFTSVAPDPAAAPGSPPRLLADVAARGVQVHTVPPPSEAGLLIRVLGGPTGALQAVRLASALGVARGRAPLPVERVVPACRALVARARAPGWPRLVDGGALAPVGVVAPGRYTDAAFAFRWKLLEGLRLPDPPVWDVLGFAHGPFQEVHDRPFTLLAFERDLPHEARLVERLARVLQPHHRLLRVAATLPGPLAWFEHDLAVNLLVAQALADLDAAGRPLDLARWPGQGEDGPLYDLDAPV